MKNLLLFSLLILALGAFSCKNDRAVREDAANSIGGGAQQTTPNTTINPTAPAPTTSVAGGVQHYICPNNCQGSGGPSQANCPVCGTAYVHNQAYHAQDVQATPQQMPTPTPMPTPTADPAQNAAGVWHYTCAKGCAGGSGAPGACAKCGGELAHNAAYHN